MGASATIAGQNLGAGNPERAVEGVQVASRIGLGVAVVIGAMFVLIPGLLLAIFGMTDPLVLVARTAAAAVPERLRAVHHRGAQLHRRAAGHRRHAQPALHFDHLAGDHPARPVHDLPGALRAEPGHIWMAIVLGHATRASLSVVRFRQGKWRSIAVDIEPARP